MLFKVSRTWTDPAEGAGPQRGFPAPGAGAQTSGAPSSTESQRVPWSTSRWVKGLRSWLSPSAPVDATRGMPAPLNAGQRRPVGTWKFNDLKPFGRTIFTETRYYDRGADAFVPNFGYLTTNPIGAGIVATRRVQASYGPSGQYENGMIFWSNQIIPTSLKTAGLSDPAVLEAILGTLNVQAAVRVDPAS